MALIAPKAPTRRSKSIAFPCRRIACALLALACGACHADDDVTGSTKCANEVFKSYNPKVLEQCVAVCKQCERGTTVTCSTSCNLKGAR
jgi:hypothetical protein